MKFLFFTDTHIRATTPANRIDSFPEALLKKFVEIQKIGKEKNVDFYIHGGDIFDRPDISIQTVRNFNRVLMTYGKPIFYVPGNHDIFAYNIGSLERTAIALLNDFGVLTTLTKGNPVLFTIGETSVALHAAPFSSELDTDIGRESYVVKKKLADFDIMTAHGMLLTKPFELINHTLIENIKHTKADLTLCGHYHDGFPLQKIDGKYFLNPGSVARMQASKVEMNRKPQVCVVTLNKGMEPIIELIPLKSAKPGNEVFDRSDLELKKDSELKKQLYEAKLSMAEMNQVLDIEEILNSIEKTETIEKEVKEYAIQLVREVENEQEAY